MELKLTPGICYLAGLYGKSKARARNAVGIDTTVKEIEQRFVEIALKELGIEPSRIIIEEKGHYRHVFFYHSRVAKYLERTVRRESIIFKRKNEPSSNYVAGLFDAAGHISHGEVSINGLTRSDELMLENLGVHTNNGRVMNLSALLSLIRGASSLLEKRGLE